MSHTMTENNGVRMGTTECLCRHDLYDRTNISYCSHYRFLKGCIIIYKLSEAGIDSNISFTRSNMNTKGVLKIMTQWLICTQWNYRRSQCMESSFAWYRNTWTCNRNIRQFSQKESDIISQTRLKFRRHGGLVSWNWYECHIFDRQLKIRSRCIVQWCIELYFTLR